MVKVETSGSKDSSVLSAASHVEVGLATSSNQKSLRILLPILLFKCLFYVKFSYLIKSN